MTFQIRQNAILSRTAEIGQNLTEAQLIGKEVMDYQLVLQFKGKTILDFDALVTLEQNLQRVVEPIAEVDGHDIGSGEINIFVFTADPVVTFERAKMLLSDASLLDKVGSAYRDLQSDKYTVIWPESSAEVFTIA